MITNFILFHKGIHLPSYVYDCIKQIESTQTNYKLFLLTDACVNIEKLVNVEIVNFNDIKIPELENIKFYTQNNDPLWRTSFERFFYIKNFIKYRNYNNIVHFDNDVLIYINVNNIINKLEQNITNIGIPSHKLGEFVCGFVYIKNSNSIELLCNELLLLAAQGEKELEIKLQSMPHEMRLLGHIFETNNTLITPLPILPFKEQSDLYETFNGVFDPSSYGQYFGWTTHFPKNTVHHSDVLRYIDKHIVSGNIKPVFDTAEKKPYIIYNNTKIPIFNLHIHSKNLFNFI